MNLKNILLVAILAVSISSCSYRLVDFTVISSKNVSLNIDKSQGKKVKGKKDYFLGIGWNIKDAMDNALDKAGPGYDLLIDGVVRITDMPFILSVSVEGTAVNSAKMKISLGEEGFQKWLQGEKVSYSTNSEVKSEATVKDVVVTE